MFTGCTDGRVANLPNLLDNDSTITREDAILSIARLSINRYLLLQLNFQLIFSCNGH